MTKEQKIAVAVAAALLIATGVYCPYEVPDYQGPISLDRHPAQSSVLLVSDSTPTSLTVYGDSLFDRPLCAHRIAWGHLVLEWLLIGVACGTFVLLRAGRPVVDLADPLK